MTKDLKYIKLEYNDCDLDYINNLFVDLDLHCEEIVDTFKLDNFGEKANVKIFDELDKFRDYLKGIRKREIEDWVCGNTSMNDVQVLSLNELRKLKNRENNTYEDLLKLIVHEFVHTIQNKKYNNRCALWISEGMACYFAGQHSDSKNVNCTVEELINGGCKYSNYKLLFEYAYNKYGMDYIEELIKDKEYAYGETKKLFDEVVNVRKNR